MPARGRGVALSGSCSAQSLRQVEAHAARHPSLAILPDEVMAGTMDAARALAWVMAHADAEPLVFSSARPDSVAAAQERFGRERVAAAIEGLMAELAAQLARAGFKRIAVGGGETSGAVVTALDVAAFSIGPEIDPGVPALAVPGSPLRLALKSGNFGADDFYAKALAALGER
jgi:uncharacterized protein YgbK (DUF1537 family)